MQYTAPYGYGLRVGGLSAIRHVLAADWVAVPGGSVRTAFAVCGAGLGEPVELGEGKVCRMCTDATAREIRATRWA